MVAFPFNLDNMLFKDANIRIIFLCLHVGM
jgi:hypothetical protein